MARVRLSAIGSLITARATAAQGRGGRAWLLISLGLLVGTAVYAAHHAGTSGFLVGSQLGADDLVLILFASLLGTLIGAYRLRSLAHDLGHPLGLRACVRAVAISQAAASVFFQILGQLASRAFLLQTHGVPPATTVLMTLVERAVGLIFLLVLAGAGAVIVFGGMQIDIANGGAELVKVACGLAFAFGAVSVATLLQTHGLPRLPRANGMALTVALLRVLLLTAAIQLTTLVAFTSSAYAFAPQADLFKLTAASTVVMLASAIPISFGGWGVRELSAVFALGAVGVPPDAAFISAATVGVLSFASALALGVVSISPGAPDAATTQYAERRIDSLSMLGWALPLLTAILIYFQLYLPVTNGNVNVCLADPLAIISAGLFVIALRHGNAHWRVPQLQMLLLCCTGVLLAGFIHGWLAFGSNTWGVTKAWGWFVLMAYGLTGALIVRIGGEDGRRALFVTLVAAFVAIVGLEYAAYASRFAGFAVRLHATERAEGFAQDPNAFAFQCLMVMALLFGPLGASKRSWVAVSACFFALWLSGSRSGWIAAAAMICVALYLRPRMLSAKVGMAAALAILAVALPPLSRLLFGLVVGGDGMAGVAWVEPVEDRSASNVERWSTLRDAFWLFVESPAFGKGLGYFVEHHTRADGSRLIVHSSYLWLMAEFGVLSICFFLTALVIAAKEWPRARTDAVGGTIILILVSFATMSLVHDLAYQRTLWFALGAALALSSPGAAGRERSAVHPSGNGP